MTELHLVSTAVLAVALSVAPSAAQKPEKVPFQDESLQYVVNWPSGLSLGEARLQSAHAQSSWKFSFSLDASIPGAAASDAYTSSAAGDFCSSEFDKQSAHGSRKASEKTTFDLKTGTATRETLKGGSSRLSIPACPRDALAFLYYLRRELAVGRLPGPQTVYFGAPYQVRLEFGGSQTIRVNDVVTAADRVVASLKGPASQSTIELYFARDAARTPVLVRVPLAVGSFSMELQR